MDREEYDRIQIDLKVHNNSRDMVKWLNNLIERINRGTSNGIYKTIPTIIDRAGVFSETAKNIPVNECLLSIMGFKPHEGDVIWSDDRYINAFANRDNIPIISICEILKSLVFNGNLERDDYYQKLNDLRAGNVRFIPIEKE